MSSSSSAVNRPTVVAQKQEDINRKLRLYGIALAFQNGKVPSNEQIDIALNSFLTSRALAHPPEKLSAEGKVLVRGLYDVIEHAKLLLLSKNQGDILQDFIWQSRKISGANAALPGTPVDAETARQHGSEVLEGLRTLGTLIISNGQFRKLLKDMTIFIRDMAGDAATHAAGKVRPSDEQLSQVDRPAADNTWHDPPSLSSGNIKQQIKSAYSKQTPVTTDDLREAAGDASENAHPSGSRDPADVAALASHDQQHGTSSGVDAQSGAQAGAATLKQRASENIPDETKEKARAQRDRVRNYLSSKMPKDRRDQTTWRLRKMVVEIQGHPDYQQAITTLLGLAETYAGHVQSIGQQSTGTIRDAHDDNASKRAEADLKILIERFANGTSTNDLFDSINVLYRDADQDPELKSWLKEINAYIRRCLQQQGYVMEDAAIDQWDVLYNRGSFLLHDRYRQHTDRIASEIKFLADQFDQDPLNTQFGNSMQKLFNNLGNDENGKPTFKPQLIQDLTEVIIPAVLENIRYVPIPRIEYSDPQMDAIVENLVIESDNLMPNILEIANDNYFRWGRKKVANRNQNSIQLSVSGIQMDLRDVSYYVRRKQGPLKITDQGVADILLGGTGLSFKIKLSTAERSDRQNFFRVDKVDVDVKNFNIKIKQSQHKMLFRLFKPFMLKVLRPALQKVIEKQIKDQVHQLDTLLYRIKQEADRAQREILENPEQAPNIYQRYVTAAHKQFVQGKNKAQEVASDVQVNVAMTQHDSIFPNIHLPGGISSEATRYKNMAMEGDSWESPIFKLGTASTSSNIPPAIEVTRKDHRGTQGEGHVPQSNGNTGSLTNQLNDPAAQNAVATNGSAGTRSATNGPSANGSGGFGDQVEQALNGQGERSDIANGKAPANTNARPTLGANNPFLKGRT